MGADLKLNYKKRSDRNFSDVRTIRKTRGRKKSPSKHKCREMYSRRSLLKESYDGLSRSEDMLPQRRLRNRGPKSKVNASNIIDVIKHIQDGASMPASSSDYCRKLGARSSMDSVIYVGTTYQDYRDLQGHEIPVIDLTKSDTNFDAFPAAGPSSSGNDNILDGNNLQGGDSSNVTGRVSVITIRPPSVRSLLSSTSENTLINDFYRTEPTNLEDVCGSLTDVSRSELKLHRTYPINFLGQAPVDADGGACGEPPRSDEALEEMRADMEIVELLHEMEKDYEIVTAQEMVGPLSNDLAAIEIQPAIDEPDLNKLDIDMLATYYHVQTGSDPGI